MPENEDDWTENKQKQKKKEDLFILKEEMFVGKNIHESYNHYHHLKVTSSKEEYFRLCRTIEFGKELLPFDDDVKPQDKEDIENLYKKACDILKTEILEKPRQDYKYGDPASKSFPLYVMKSADGGEISCLQEQYVDAVAFFIETQYSHHIPDLREVDAQIFHFLMKYKVISKTPSVDDLIDEQMKKEILSDSLISDSMNEEK